MTDEQELWNDQQMNHARAYGHRERDQKGIVDGKGGKFGYGGAWADASRSGPRSPSPSAGAAGVSSTGGDANWLRR